MMHLSKPISEQKKKESLRHHSFFLMNGGDGSGENSDSTSAKQPKVDRGKDKDPSPLWRDFVGEKTHHNASLYEEKDMDDCLDDAKPPPGTKEHKQDLVPCPSDGIQDVDMVTHQVASNTEGTPNQSGPTPRKSNRSSIPISLEEGWKGIMVASFGASGTSTTTSVRSSLLLDHESEGSIPTDYGSFAMASTETASEAPTFPSDAAWVPVLSDNDNDSDCEDNSSNNENDPSTSKHKTGNDKNPVYAALVLDSMLGSESETEKHNDGKEEDSLLWTWVGGDGNIDDFPNMDASPPPTEEIAFDVSWEDAVAGDDDEETNSKSNSSNNSDGNIDSNEGSNKTPTSPDGPTNNSDDDDTARDVPSLSLFAACTYSRVFGLDYLHDPDESRSGDEDHEGGNEEDYTNEPPPMRSTIPYGGSTVSETRSDNDGHGRDDHACGMQQSGAKSFKKCLWISVISGLLIVFGLAFMVIYFAIDTMQGSGRL